MKCYRNKGDWLKTTVIQKTGNSYPVFWRVAGVTQSEPFDLFDVDMVVETDEVSPLLLLPLGAPRGPGRGGWGSAGLGNGQSAAGAHRHRTALTAGCKTEKQEIIVMNNITTCERFLLSRVHLDLVVCQPIKES